MRILRFLTIAAALLLLPALAAAQRMPQEGGWSLWAGIGITNPTDEDFDADFGFSGGFDYFVTRNFSLGALGGAWKADSDFPDDPQQAYVNFVATYNWEGGKLHPYVQGGVGPYFVDYPFGADDTEFGGFLGGGLDIFFTEWTAIDLAFRYHIVSDIDIGFDDELDGSFFEAHGGIKFYF